MSSSNNKKNNDPSKYVKLISGDGHEFYLERRVAMGSKTIATMLGRLPATFGMYF